MSVLEILEYVRDDIFALPTTFLFLGVAIFLTFKTGFIQLRSFKHFWNLITKGFARSEQTQDSKTMNSFHALFTAMSTTIGMGNLVGPSVAIFLGGPGALFWLVFYNFFASVTKYTEVVYALHTRIKTSTGEIIGGPMQYLKSVSPALAYWYSAVMLFLFAGWSGTQANTLASVFALEGIPAWATGIFLVVVVLAVMSGGAKRVGNVASKLVPIMFTLYISFAFLILFKDTGALINAIRLVGQSIFSPAAAMGGFLGASVFKAIQAGVFKGIFVTEAGLGTASIPHSMADTKKPTDQGVLAMYSMVADTLLCTVSGLLVLVTGVWIRGEFRSTFIYEAFKLNAPGFGQWVLMISIGLFVLTTVIGNSFNGVQSFASLTNHRWKNWYLLFNLCVIFLGALTHVKIVWTVLDIFLALVAIPNLIGLVMLSLKKPKVLLNK